MARDYTADELIKSVQQKAQIALAARDFGTVQILRLFNEEIDGYLVPFVAQRRLEFWVESATVNVTAGTAAYPIPSVAMGGKLRALALLQGGIPYVLDQIDLSAAVQAQGQSLQGFPPCRYYFMGNSFVLFPAPAGSATVLVYYYRRPSELVLKGTCLQVTAVSAAGSNLSLDFNDPSGLLLSTYDGTAAIDLVSNSSGFGVLLSDSMAFNTIIPPTVTFTGLAALASVVQIGDWMALTGTSPVITGCPADIINLITQEVALKVAEAKGGTATIAALSAGLARAEKSAGWTVQQRNDGAARKLSAFPEDATGAGYPYG